MPASIANAAAKSSLRPPPSLALSTVALVALAGLWGYVRLSVFSDSYLPLTYVLPLLAAVWTRRVWHVWAMAFTFVAFSVIKAGQFADDGAFDSHDRLLIVTTLLNILVGAVVVQSIVRYRVRIDAQAALIAGQNAELEAQAAELAQQNEEIRTQAEELAQQNEEVHSQAEELSRQNDELQLANSRLTVREELLQDLLQFSRGPDTVALAAICSRALAVIGAPADRACLLERRDDGLLHVLAQATQGAVGQVPSEWPLENSLAGTVLREDRTAYVSDLSLEPGLAAPFDDARLVQSLLATPLRIEGTPIGVLAIASRQATHWTEEQFQLVEWIAAMCGQLAKGVRAREAIEARTRELESASRAKDEFLAMLSHELRTPLTPVLAASGVLSGDTRLPADVREDLLMIRRNVTIQSRLIDDLLDLTRIERRKLDLNHQPCAPAQLLRDAAAIATPDVDAKEQRLTVRCDVPDRWRISGDPARLQQVLWNLLQNATKFSPPRTHVQLSAHLRAGAPAQVEITVEDEGCGIAPSEFERIFRPFEQIRNGRRVGRETGLGLGLAIARAIVELHGGKLTVSAGMGGLGTRFTVDLPLVLAGSIPPFEGAPPREMRPETPRSALSILLVEDHTDTGRVIAQLLKGAGHQVVHTTNATDAASRFAESRFDLLISDIGLPDESGLVLMRKLRELNPLLPGICMTGYGMESDQRACLEAGFSEHLAKPVDVQRLHAAINRVARPAR